ncbi:LysR substrate-binding domain-containing protein [Kiloniella laminariae]|uniref:LysR substrate-binding domain-containing protein n=1 Tax=Kiloniella laminariae TaxID=454162 RepID=A0ABT4LNW9_9PROT|nr:LysR substrate-binding domain-containing protein [Kiloniella laminariae]MCZ4282808.1 LysR substrate-binding domain-containing protein [Kiloniella laminariae]
MVSSSLPPLSSLRVFEAAARHCSFTRAAEELGMTQAAVSYQIKILEERVGSNLFLRKPRQVSLSETGLRLAPVVSQAFDLLHNAFAAEEDDSQSLLTISTLQTFAANYLVERIGRFQMEHCNLAVRLDASQEMRNFAREEFDLGIRSGMGDWPGLATHLLMTASFTPMLSPGLAESIDGVKEPADLLRLPFIDASDPWWKVWFDAAGVPSDELKARPRSRLGSQTLEATAAMAGQGVAVLTPMFYRKALNDGSLIQPFDLVCKDLEGRGYWLVYPESRRNSRKIKAFRRWLEVELKQSFIEEDLAIKAQGCRKI